MQIVLELLYCRCAYAAAELSEKRLAANDSKMIIDGPKGLIRDLTKITMTL
jgi:hypothetical protein